MKILSGITLCALMLAGCTPAEQSYCERNATPVGSPEYGKCVQYFFQQSAIFDADRSGCELDADQTYPSSLYDNGRTEWVHGGYGPHGDYYGGHSIDISPDYAHNAQIDNLRMRIIGPCMQSKGWVDPNGWEAGRMQTQRGKIMPNRAPNMTPMPSAQPLPWLTK